jgi:hypothetical protein
MFLRLRKLELEGREGKAQLLACIFSAERASRKYLIAAPPGHFIGNHFPSALDDISTGS